MAQSGGGKLVVYAGVGPELRWYDANVADATLEHRGSVRVPANIQYVWPHVSRRYLYATSSDSASGLGGFVGKTHHAAALRERILLAVAALGILLRGAASIAQEADERVVPNWVPSIGAGFGLHHCERPCRPRWRGHDRHHRCLCGSGCHGCRPVLQRHEHGSRHRWQGQRCCHHRWHQPEPARGC